MIDRLGAYPAGAIWGMQAREGGLVIMIRAFFDETDSHRAMPERLIGIGCVIFDDSGYEEFRRTWSERTGGLKKPFRMADCYNGFNQFSEPPWNREARQLLWRGLGSLIAKTSLAQTVAYIWQADYDEFVAEHPRVPSIIGSAYSVCLLYCSELVGGFTKKEPVFFTFESGHPREREAADFFQKAMANPKAREQINIGGYAFIDKAQEPSLCSADYMAWSFQRALAEPQDKKGWHEAFDIVRRDESKPTYVARIRGPQLNTHVLFNAFYGIHNIEKRI